MIRLLIIDTYILRFCLTIFSKKVKIINHPFAVRNVSEKLFSINFMKYMPPTLISENLNEIRSFFKRHKVVVAKPINGFSGNNVTLLKTFNAIKIRKLLKTHNHLFFQKFLPEVSKGDKRVFIIKGKIAGVISRVPKKGSILSNMSKELKQSYQSSQVKKLRQVKLSGNYY